MTVDPGAIGAQDVYKLLIGVIVPRPIAWVSSLSLEGVRNLAPFSFFTAVSADPPVICFCPMVSGTGANKDTLNNIRATGEFVVNIVGEEVAAKMNQTSGTYPPEVDEFAVAGLTAVPSELVRPPRVEESQVHMECVLHQLVEVSPKPLGGTIVLGRVVRFHLHDALVDNYRVDPDVLKAIGRMGGASYARTADRFDLPRPQV